MSKQDPENIYLVHCSSQKHKSGSSETFYLFTPREPGEVLDLLGCPLLCGEKLFNVRAEPVDKEKFFQELEKDIKAGFQAFRDLGTSYEEIDLEALFKGFKSYYEKGDQPFINVSALDAHLEHWIIDQPIPRKKVVRRVRVAERGLRNLRRPKGVFLFLGPPGSGKTRFVEEFCQFVLGTREPTATLDMTKYQERHTVANLTGAPPGYVGYGDALGLAAVEDKPIAVVLLDEFDKAHPNVWKAFLRIFDRGRLDDVKVGQKNARGQNDSASSKTIYFNHCYFFLTSNIATEKMLDLMKGRGMGFHPPQARKELDHEVYEVGKKEVEKAFREVPAIIRRFHVVAVFHVLDGAETLNKIIDLRMEEYEDEGIFQANDLTVTLSDEARAFIIGRYKIELGATSIELSVETYVFGALDRGLTDGKIKPGDHVVIKDPIKQKDGDDDEGNVLDFEVVKKPPALPEGGSSSGP